MGATKMDFYTDHQIEMAKRCKSLGHPARIAIIEKLMEDDHLNCTDLQFFIPLAQSTISQHLKELFNAGILGFKVIGNNCYYYINKDTISQVVIYLSQIRLLTKDNKTESFIYFKPSIKQKQPYFMRI